MARSSSYLVLRDLGIIALSIVVAALLGSSDVLQNLLDATESLRFIGSFFAGMLYTSLFTTAPAIVAIGQISQSHSPLEVALVGGLGALIGDFFLFHFVRDSLSPHLLSHVHIFHTRHIRRLFSRGPLRWVSPILGTLIIASPLPDELGLIFLGFSKTKTTVFVSLSYLANFIGILTIGIVARALH